jgi:hypothetical protein
MAIPKYDEIQFEALRVMLDCNASKFKIFIDPHNQVFNLKINCIQRS